MRPPSRSPRLATRKGAVPPRWRCAPPAQARSRETVQLFARAAEDLLRSRPFEEIGVQDIARRAGRPVGSFYARFASKDALLPYLYQRYHEGLEALFVTRLQRVAWARLGYARTVATLVEFLLGLYVERRWLIRALALFTRMRPESLPGDLVERRRRVYDHAVAILLRHRAHIAHADPEAAIRFAVFAASSVAREKLLFGDAPHSRVTPMARETLRRELVRMIHTYLSKEVPR